MVDYSESLDDGVLKQQNLERVTTVEKMEDRSWDRDNISERVSEVENNKDTIETILQDLEEKIDSVPSREQLEEEWSAYLDRVEKDNKGNPKRYPPAFVDAERERFQLMMRRAIWEARLRELETFSREKLADKFVDLLDEYRALKSESRLEDILDVEGKFGEIKELKHQIEKMGQSLREEKRSLWRMMERVAETEGTGLTKSDVEEAAEKGLESFVKSDGQFVLDSDELERDRKQVERDVAAQSAAENVAGEKQEEDDSNGENVYELKGKSVDEQYEALESLASEHKPVQNGFTQSEVAELTDVTPAAIFQDGGILDSVQEEDLFPGVDVRDQ